MFLKNDMIKQITNNFNVIKVYAKNKTAIIT
jgi:hypothetical protein